MGNIHRVGRAIKAAMRKLDYRASVPELLGMARAVEVKRKEERTLTGAERYRFRRWLVWKYGPDCAYCGKFYPLAAMTIDHIQPKSKGGAVRDIQNMALACRGCNKDKGDDWTDYTTVKQS